MNTTASLLQNYKIPTLKSRRSERGDLISFFCEKINADRVGTKYKPISISSMGNLLGIYTTEDLYHLRMKCDRAKNFSATFWWYVKLKPKQNQSPK